MSNTVDLSVELKQEALSTYAASQSMEITDDSTYQGAVDYIKVIKTKAAEVKAYFAPMKEAAHQAHKQVCDRESELLKPLNDAEAKIKGAMSVYAMKKAEEARKIEEAKRKAAEEEMQRKLAEAMALQAANKQEQANAALNQAIEQENLFVAPIVVAPSAPKTSGVSQKKDWKIIKVDSLCVPIEQDGVVFRPVDEATILRYIRQTEGKTTIPGVTFEETVTFSINSKR